MISPSVLKVHATIFRVEIFAEVNLKNNIESQKKSLEMVSTQVANLKASLLLLLMILTLMKNLKESNTCGVKQ